jgi:hypothetical protein
LIVGHEGENAGFLKNREEFLGLFEGEAEFFKL